MVGFIIVGDCVLCGLCIGVVCVGGWYLCVGLRVVWLCSVCMCVCVAGGGSVVELEHE